MMTAMMMATATMMPRTAVPTMMTSPAALLPSPLLTYFYLPKTGGHNDNNDTKLVVRRIYLPKELRPLPCSKKIFFFGF